MPRDEKRKHYHWSLSRRTASEVSMCLRGSAGRDDDGQLLIIAEVAQLVERPAVNREVSGFESQLRSQFKKGEVAEWLKAQRC